MDAGTIHWCQITAPEFRVQSKKAWEQAREYGAYVPFEKIYQCRDGSLLPVLIGGVRLRREPLEILSWVVNLTEQKRAAEAEQQARQLEARGRLVNRLAHDINNPLEALTNLLYLLRGDTALNPQAAEYVAKAGVALDRINGTVEALLAEASRRRRTD